MDVIVNKNIYNAPNLKVVSFQVEGGFGDSLMVGDRSQDATEAPVYGTSEIKTDFSTDNWAGSVI